MDNPSFFTSSSEDSKGICLQATFSALYHEYDVLLEVEKPTGTTKIEYSLGVKYECPSSNLKNNILSFHRLSKIFINESEFSVFSEEVSSLAGKVFWPLFLEITPEGKIAKFISHEATYKRWKYIQEELLKIYPTKSIDKYIESLDKYLSSPEKLIDRLQNDWFISLYCVPLYTYYKADPEKENWKFPSLLKGKDKTEYIISKSSENLNDPNDSIIVYIQDLTNNNLVTCIYTLDNTNKLIKNIEASITEDHEHKINIEIQLVRSHKKKESSLDPNQYSKAEKKDLNDKKGFWEDLV